MTKFKKGYLKLKEGEITGVASTETPDRDGEIISQMGWDLTNFKKNPVLLASHNHLSFPIGNATALSIENGKLVFKAMFSKATREAKEAYELVKEGVLRTFSVGFIPREYDKQNNKIITKAELLEISLVSVPANPEAVVIAKGMKNNLAKKMVKEWLKDKMLQKGIKKIEKKVTEEKVLELLNEFSKEKKLPPTFKFVGDKYIATEVRKDKTTEKKATSRSINLKLIQRTVGLMQEVCRDLKNGGENK